jgi:hypothetical protein
MTVRIRLMILTVLGLAVTMAVWGWIQIKALDQILVEQQGKRLSSVAETVSAYYQHFPTGRGLSILDITLKEQLQTDVRLARIDLFAVVNYDVDYIEYKAGASRVRYEWPDTLVSSVAASRKPRYVRLRTDEGPAVGLLYPVKSEKTRATQFVVGVTPSAGPKRRSSQGRSGCSTSARPGCSSSSCWSWPRAIGG